MTKKKSTSRAKAAKNGIRKAIWSFWSKPFNQQRSFWQSERHHLMSWVLSVQTARKHFPHTALYTDAAGAEMLVEGIGLEFDQVSTSLDALNHNDPDFWCLGKILAYSVQQEPFFHIDSDLFLWAPLPDRLLHADVAAQNPEEGPIGLSCYQPEQVEAAIRSVGGWLPPELAEHVTRDGVHRAFCCGILGGCRTDFLRDYAAQVLRLVGEPGNQPGWQMLADRKAVNPFLEQYMLAVCLDYHSGRTESPYAGIGIECMFRDLGDAVQRAEQVGFTHLVGATKQDPDILARLERRVRTDFPAFYERCMDYYRRRDDARVTNLAVSRGER